MLPDLESLRNVRRSHSSAAPTRIIEQIRIFGQVKLTSLTIHVQVDFSLNAISSQHHKNSPSSRIYVCRCGADGGWTTPSSRRDPLLSSFICTEQAATWYSTRATSCEASSAPQVAYVARVLGGHGWDDDAHHSPDRLRCWTKAPRTEHPNRRSGHAT